MTPLFASAIIAILIACEVQLYTRGFLVASSGLASVLEAYGTNAKLQLVLMFLCTPGSLIINGIICVVVFACVLRADNTTE